MAVAVAVAEEELVVVVFVGASAELVAVFAGALVEGVVGAGVVVGEEVVGVGVGVVGVADGADGADGMVVGVGVGHTIITTLITHPLFYSLGTMESGTIWLSQVPT